MDNLIYGIIIIIICTAGYAVAYKFWRKNKTALALCLIILCGGLLRLYASMDCYLHEWDERYHALVAKNVMQHPLHPTLYDDPVIPYDYKNWIGNHTWLHKQPIPLWTMAGSMAVLGINEIALRLPSIILTTIGIWVTFYIGRYLFNKRVGMIAAFLYSIHGLIIELTAGRVPTDHVDVFFLFFIQMAVLLAIRFFETKNAVYNILCGVTIGLAIMTKWLPAIIVLPIWILLALDAGIMSFRLTLLHFITLCATLVMIAVPWQLYIFYTFPEEAQWESIYNVRHITNSLEEHGKPFLYHINRLRIIYGELIYLPMLWFLYKTFKKRRNFKRLILAIWILIPLLFFSFVKTKMQGYTLFTAPAIFIVTGLFIEYLSQFRTRFKPKWPITLLLLLLIALPVRYSIERIKPFTLRDRNPPWSKELRALSGKINPDDRVVIFNTEHPIEMMFYVDCTAYSWLPDSQTLDNLKRKGHTVYIRHNLTSERNPDYDKNDLVLLEYNAIYERLQ